MKSFSAPLLRRLFFGLCLTAVACPVFASDDGLPDNLGQELHPLVLWQRSQERTLRSQSKTDRQTSLKSRLGRNTRRVQTDDDSRVIVRVRLDGSASAETVKVSLAALGADVAHHHAARRADGRDGVLTVHLPLAQAEAAAKLPGVHSVLAAHRPRARAGATTSQGVGILRSDVVNSLGYTGKGITVGVVSDSYDVATTRSTGATVSTRASDDIRTGDLPGPGNPDGYTTPVALLADGRSGSDSGNIDEGRAMLQIIHDIAPGANLAFHTVGDTPEEFADAIRALRTSPTALCDVIVDDISFSEEPFFSDGVVSEAVDDVVTSTTLAGRPAAYFSASGNDGNVSYDAQFNFVSYNDGLASKLGNLQLGSVPRELIAGGFHNFKAADIGKGVNIVQKITVSDDDAELNFQWNDPFLPDELTTSYSILVFDASGRYLAGRSGTDNAFRTGEAIQFAELTLNGDGSDTTYQIVIGRRDGGTQAATRLRYIAFTGGTVVGKYLRTGQATIYGHSGARGAEGVSAYDVHDLSLPETYDSFGPVMIYFDAQGNRLATPEVRLQPTMAAVDGVDTTFFDLGDLADSDSDNTGFPNFYGTSAAAPHAAAVAALLLQAGGGRGSLSPASIHDLMTSTAEEHDLDAANSQATLTGADGALRAVLTAHGDDSNNSAFDQKFFTLFYDGPAGSSLLKAAIDISPAREVFDSSVDLGFPFTVGGASGGVVKASVTASVSEGSRGDGKGSKLTLKFPAGTFPAGGTLQFGIDRDLSITGSAGNSADLLAGSTVTLRALLTDGSKVKLTGEIVNQRGHGYSPDVGYGLINAEAALNKLLGR